MHQENRQCNRESHLEWKWVCLWPDRCLPKWFKKMFCLAHSDWLMKMLTMHHKL